MENQYLAETVKKLRIKKGMTQEFLAEESGLSLRTIQRIENGENRPTGDTLQRLSKALEVNPDQLLEWEMKVDNKYLTFLNLSALSFLIFPILGLLIPFIMWTSQKDKIKGVKKIGEGLINFQITWVILLFVIPLTIFIFYQVGLFNSLSFINLISIGIILYLFNFLMIIINTIRILREKEVVFFSVFKFVR